jgi:hypothetical protein
LHLNSEFIKNRLIIIKIQHIIKATVVSPLMSASYIKIKILRGRGIKLIEITRRQDGALNSRKKVQV